MTPELIGSLVIAAIMVVIIVIIIFRGKADIDGTRVIEAKNDENDLSLSEDESAEADVQSVTMHARVIDMACSVKSVGTQCYKLPKAVKTFAIQFQNDAGEILDLTVTEEMYDGFDKGLAGSLTIVDGKLDSFVPDED